MGRVGQPRRVRRGFPVALATAVTAALAACSGSAGQGPAGASAAASPVPPVASAVRVPLTVPAGQQIRQSLPWTFVWAFAHYLIFASVAALGAGLQVAIGTFDHEAAVSPSFAAFCIAIPVVTFVVVLGLLNIRGSDIAAPGLTLLTAALVLAAAAATPLLTLPVSTVLMVVLVVLLLAYHLTAAYGAIPG
jgi:Bacterial low temperature requirement A protein (LtrA)